MGLFCFVCWWMYEFQWSTKIVQASVVILQPSVRGQYLRPEFGLTQSDVGKICELWTDLHRTRLCSVYSRRSGRHWEKFHSPVFRLCMHFDCIVSTLVHKFYIVTPRIALWDRHCTEYKGQMNIVKLQMLKVALPFFSIPCLVSFCMSLWPPVLILDTVT